MYKLLNEIKKRIIYWTKYLIANYQLQKMQKTYFNLRL